MIIKPSILIALGIITAVICTLISLEKLVKIIEDDERESRILQEMKHVQSGAHQSSHLVDSLKADQLGSEAQSKSALIGLGTASIGLLLGVVTIVVGVRRHARQRWLLEATWMRRGL